MQFSAKSLNIIGIVFAILTFLSGVCKIIDLVNKSQIFHLPTGLPVILMLATVGFFSAARKMKNKESKNI